MPSACNVSVYTTHEQSEQPAIVHHVTALVLVGGLLTIECDVVEKGHTFSAHHRFEEGQWAHFEASLSASNPAEPKEGGVGD